MFRRQFCSFFAAIPFLASFLVSKDETKEEKFDPEPKPGDAQYGWYDAARMHRRNEIYWRDRALCAEQDLEQREEAIELAENWLEGNEFKSTSSNIESHYAWYCLHDARRPHSHVHCLNGTRVCEAVLKTGYYL